MGPEMGVEFSFFDREDEDELGGEGMDGGCLRGGGWMDGWWESGRVEGCEDLRMGVGCDVCVCVYIYIYI